MSEEPDSLLDPIEGIQHRPDCVGPFDGGLQDWLRERGWNCRTWTDRPGTNHPPHAHPYSHRVLCVSGWIEFTVGGDSFRLTPGDALDLPEGVTHGAHTSPDDPTEYWLLRPD